jgi:outer membrane protein TolC
MPAVNTWQHDIKDQQIVFTRPGQMQAVGAVARQISNETGFGEPLLQVIAGFGFVFDNQQSHRITIAVWLRPPDYKFVIRLSASRCQPFGKVGALMKSTHTVRKLLIPAFLILAPLPAWSAATLAEALDKAWERAVQARVAESRRGVAAASRMAAESLFPEPPAVGISHRDDRFNKNRGLREHELELALPLWLPGQRDARRALAAWESADIEAAIAAARLNLAGELRAAIWAYASTNTALELAQERVAASEQLAADIARREAAGDLARTDLLLANEELLAARVALAEALTRQRHAIERYRLLTGLESLPTQIEESVAEPEVAVHPRQRLAATGAEHARAALQWVRENRRDAPELTIGWQQSRDESSVPESHSLRIGIRIPFASEGRNAPHIAAANASLIRAEAEYRQVMAALETEQRAAFAELEYAELADAADRLRAELTRERLQHLQRAFELGELPLGELMRVRGAATEARLEAAQSRLAVAAARARINQTRGLLP